MKIEDFEYCKRIATELENYVNGNVYRCPCCREQFEWDNDHYNNETGEYICPHCESALYENELEALSIYDWATDLLDIEYRCNHEREYRSVRVMVVCGGPNIYVDTASKQVELYWGGDQASYCISYEASDALDEWAEEYWC